MAGSSTSPEGYRTVGISVSSPAWLNILLFILGAAWGLQFVLLKIATDTGLGEIKILTASLAMLAGGFLAALIMTRSWFRPSWRHIRFFVISGFLGFLLPLGGAVLAARDISAGVIVLIEALTPVFTIAIAMALRTEAVTSRGILAVALGLLGVLCLLVPAIAIPAHGSLAGLGFALIVPIACALDGIYVAARWPEDIRPLQVVTGEAVAGACLILPFLLWMDDTGPPLMSWTNGHWAIMLFVIIGFLEAYLYFYLLRRAGAVFVSLASLISLFAGIAFGMVLIGESHPMPVWLAVGLTTIALYHALADRSQASKSSCEDSGSET